MRLQYKLMIPMGNLRKLPVMRTADVAYTLPGVMAFNMASTTLDSIPGGWKRQLFTASSHSQLPCSVVGCNCSPANVVGGHMVLCATGRCPAVAIVPLCHRHNHTSHGASTQLNPDTCVLLLPGVPGADLISRRVAQEIVECSRQVLMSCPSGTTRSTQQLQGIELQGRRRLVRVSTVLR